MPEHRAVRPEWQTGWEVKRIEAMMSDARGVIFDIGAEEGDMSALLASKADKMVLFEPNPKVWANIKAIWEWNKLKTPIQYVGFASNKTEENPENLYISKEKKNGWTIYAYGELIGDHGFKELANEADGIPQIKLDDFCEREKLYPDLITIDVEGSEFEVLKGSENILKTKKPIVYISIHSEFMFNYFNQYTSELFGYMDKLGYKFELLDYDHELHVKFSK